MGERRFVYDFCRIQLQGLDILMETLASSYVFYGDQILKSTKLFYSFRKRNVNKYRNHQKTDCEYFNRWIIGVENLRCISCEARNVTKVVVAYVKNGIIRSG